MATSPKKKKKQIDLTDFFTAAPKESHDSEKSDHVDSCPSVPVSNATAKPDSCSSEQVSYVTDDSCSGVSVSRKVHVHDVPATDFMELFTDKTIPEIHSYYICSARRCNALSENEKIRVGGIEKTNRTKKDKFHHSWLNDFFDYETGIYWMIYVEGMGMFCYLCRKHDAKNSKNNSKVFNEEPALRNRSEALKGHAQSSQHKSAVQTELTKRCSTFHIEKTMSEKCTDQILYEVFACQYWLAKECIANCKLSSLLKFLEHLGNDHIKYFQHKSQGSLREMFLQLGSTVRKHILDNVSGNYGLMVDEVADIANCEQLVTFIQYYHSQEVKVKFLDTSDVLENFNAPNAEAITSTIKTALASCGLPVENMTGLSTDGASVMTGKNNGVAVQFKKENPKLITFHCICHRLALGCNDANDEIAQIKKIERWLITLWKWFENSPKKLAAYLKMQLQVKTLQEQAINDKTHERLQKRLAKACRTRWLSLEKAITGVHRDYESLVFTLREFKNDDPTASGLLMKLLDVNFVIGIYILHDVLPHLNKVSTSFQESYISFSRIESKLQKCHDDLDSLVEEEQCIAALKDDLKQNGRLSCLEIEFSETHEQRARNFLNKYVNALKTNMDRRFQPAMPILKAFEIFDPLLVPPRGSAEFRRYGCAEIELIGEHYSVHKEQLSEEWAVFKYHLLKWKEEYSQIQSDTDLSAVEWCLSRLVSAPLGLFSLPKLSSVAAAIIVIPVSNAWPERGASKLKLIKSRLRSSMKNDVLNSLMQISMNGPPSSSAEMREIVTETVHTWLKMKNRRKLPKNKFDMFSLTKESTSVPVPVKTVDAEVQTNVTLEMISDEVQRFSKELYLDDEEEEDEDEYESEW